MRVKVTVNEALVDQHVVDLGYAYEMQLKDARQHGDHVLWLGVTVENLRVADDLWVGPSQFQVVDTDKVVHSYKSSNREINATISKDRVAKGGVLFLIPTNASPNFLVYNPGIKIDTYEFGPVDLTTHVALPLRSDGASLVQDREYWRKTNPFPTKDYSRPQPKAKPDDSRSIEMQRQKKNEADAKLLKWQQQQASNGVAYSQFDLGMRYFKGDGVESNVLKAVEWIGKSAAQKYGPAVGFLKTNLPSKKPDN